MPISSILKLYNKIFRRDKYYQLKYQKLLDDRINYYNSEIYKKILEIEKNIKDKKELSFLHSGHLGDIIYALPTIKELSKNHVCNFYIQINKPMELHYPKHPSGDFYLDRRITELFIPLLEKQNYLNKVEIFSNQTIDVDLDLFRKMPINIQFYSPRWFFQLTGTQVNLEKPCLDVQPHKKIVNKVVILRTFRARSHFINYKFLKSYNDLVFVGLRDEFDDLKKQVPNLQFYDCKNFLEMAEIIKASKMFIGNQSPGYGIAESLKIPRLLEANPDFPVIFPIGEKSYDFYHQVHFEKFFKKLYY